MQYKVIKIVKPLLNRHHPKKAKYNKKLKKSNKKSMKIYNTITSKMNKLQKLKTENQVKQKFKLKIKIKFQNILIMKRSEKLIKGHI